MSGVFSCGIRKSQDEIPADLYKCCKLVYTHALSRAIQVHVLVHCIPSNVLRHSFALYTLGRIVPKTALMTCKWVDGEDTCCLLFQIRSDQLFNPRIAALLFECVNSSFVMLPFWYSVILYFGQRKNCQNLDLTSATSAIDPKQFVCMEIIAGSVLNRDLRFQDKRNLP